jgi:hypothetical protein
MVLFGVVWMSGLAMAADARPIVGPGATKDEVIDAYGWPTGQSQAGAKEILIYPQGRVILDKGRVETVDFSLNMAWPAPKPRPGTAGGGESWYTNWPEALKEAQRRHVRLLLLFVGSDWSPPSRQFLNEVAESTDFLTACLGNFVLVKLDFPTRTTQLKSLRTQNAELRERYEVTTYPALVITEPTGALAARVDLTRARPVDSYRTQVIAAVREARETLPVLLAPLAPPPTANAGTSDATKIARPQKAPTAAASPEADPGDSLSATTASLWKASWALMWGLGAGLLVVIVTLSLIWRKRTQHLDTEPASAAARVADAASGLPSALEMAEWTHAQLKSIVAAVAETDSYEVVVRGGGAEGDLSLTRVGEGKASVIVACLPAAAGPVSAKRLRELFGLVTIEEVGVGWFVSMAGFSAEARDYAQQHGLVLIGREGLREQLRALTERDLVRVLARGR